MGNDNGLPLCSSTLEYLMEELARLETCPIPPLRQDDERPWQQDGSQTVQTLLKLVGDLYEAAPVGYLYLGRQGDIRSVNHSCAELLGSSRSSLVGCSLDPFLSDEARPLFHDFLQRVFAEGAPETCEIVFRKHGHTLLSLQIEAIVCRSGEECRAVVTDITGRGQAEQALRAAQGEAARCRAEMAALMDAVPAAVLIAHDAECRHISGSRVTQEMSGLPLTINFSKSAPVLEQPTNFVLMRHGREIPARLLPVQLAAAGQEVRDYEYERVFADGTVRTMFGNAVPLRDGRGRPRGAIGAFIDITERKLAEEAQRRAKEEWERTFASVPALISIIDNQHRVLRVNEAMARRLGREPEQCVGLTCYEVIHGGAVPHQCCPHSRTIRDGGEHVEEMRIDLFGGDFQVVTTPLLDEEGERIGSVHIAHDITERKRMEDALRASEQRVRLKLESILAPEGDIGSLSLADIIDTQTIQALMDAFYGLTRIPMALIDSEGTILIRVGWQSICTTFHRRHPETSMFCVESDIQLTAGISEGELRLYKCRNNMWDIATPIVMGGKCFGNLFMGQFFFDDEEPDHELFRSQAARYGFDEAEYLAALATVPRLSRSSVEHAMDYFIKFVALISKLSYSNIKLARSLAERDALMDSLRTSQEQNEFLADIVRHAAQPFVQSYPDGRVGLVNDAFEQLSGYTVAELMCIDWATTLTPPEWRQVEQETLDELQRTGKPVRYEKELIRKDGSRVPVELLVHMVSDMEGTPQYYYSFITDITERKLAGEAIARRNALLMGINFIFKEALQCRTEEELADACLNVAEEITASSFGFIGEIGADGLFHDIVISETGWAACSMHDCDGNHRPSAVFPMHGIYSRVLLDGASFFTNDPASHPDSIGLPAGHPPLASFLGVPLKDGEKTIGMIGVGNRDGGYCQEEREFLEGLAPAIVEAFQRKRAEDALKKLNEELENLVAERTKELEFKNLILSTQNETFIDGILVVDEEHKIISCNRRFLELWGIPPALTKAGEAPLLELAASRVTDSEGFLSRVNELYDNREEKSWEEILLKDGRVFDRYSAPMLGDDGTYFGKVWYFRDITERKEAERALRQETIERLQAVEALREKERMLIQQSRLAAMGEMIGNIAHQWRQPLNNLGLIIQQLPIFHDYGELTGEFLDENVLQAMDIIQHMSKTIDDFRNYFRPDKEKMHFRVREAIDTTLALVRDSFRNQHIGIVVNAVEDSSIFGYRNEFAQVLLNILNNARDVLAERGTHQPRVTVSMFGEGDRAVVTIVDNAGGIPEEIKGKIFDPYFTTKGPQSGTGVGLFMSKAIIEKNMGGRLTARNIDGGAEFRIEV
ncbi:PAS domain S-box protein [Pelobacter propionicus]|uniref:histidine kinase n=1 Tax=Pelobacter propionicus (strain DSM 2379 / NBRC 103807 / OttBd1) TaxID=338966 RepID=A1AUZ3_PELPD|nr:PAS domain S-box protein [Pelobacter propionicus]ABL01164.1 multi-sensor signal transduction histidine kinase [Pelobacter propionicus DSM 2379]